MPTAAPKPCSQCGVLVRDGSSRCEQHKVREGTFADRQRGSRQDRGYGAEWDRKRKEILQRDAGICQVGMEEGHVHEGTEVDHKINKAEWKRRFGTLAGVDHPSNLRCICTVHHRAKTQAEASRGRGASNLWPSRG